MKDFQTKLIAIFGEGNVSYDKESLKVYAEAEGFVCGLMPVAEVFAENEDQVLQLIKLANEEKWHVIPVSSAGNHRHGGTTPAAPEVIMLNLSRMKKVTSINPVFRMAVIQPGLTYGEFQKALDEFNLTIAMPLAPRAEKSVIASLLEVEPRMNPNTQWNVPDPIRSTDTIWGEGRRMYTGDASLGPNSIEEQQKNENWQIGSGGPDMVDYIRFLTGSQGTLGVVVNASVRLAQVPLVEKCFVVSSDDLDKNIEFMYAAEHLRFGDCLFTVNSATLAMLMAKTKDEIKCLTKELPKYITVVCAQSRNYAPQLRVDAHTKGLSDAAAKNGLQLLEAVGPFTAKQIHDVCFTPCQPGDYWKERFMGASADLLFETTMNKVNGFVDIFNKEANKLSVDCSECGLYIQPQHQGVNCQVEFLIPYNPDCKTCKGLAEELFANASVALSKADAYFHRPYGQLAKLQLSKDAMSYAALEKIEKIFDPNEVLNPGKLKAF